MATSPYTPIVGFKPLTQIAPFTYRDGATYVEILKCFEEWLKNIGVELDASLDEFLKEIGDIETAWNTKFDEFMANIEAQLLALNDEAVSQLVRDTQSQLRAELEILFDAKTDVFKQEVREELAEVNNEIAEQIGTVANKAATYDELLFTQYMVGYRLGGTSEIVSYSDADSAPTFFVAPFNMRIIGFSLIFDRFNLATSGTDYLNMRLRVREGKNPDSIATIAEKQTTTYQGEAITERVPWDFANAEWTEANRMVKAGDVLTLHWMFYGALTQIDFPISLVVRYAPV